MTHPQVSFIVPCYKLAHLLGECVNSILRQSFRNFEILIMDDCSPDHTAEVAASFADARVRYIRNDPNLGHLRNYNKGIAESRGDYVWLISADDYLRSTLVLERYVQLMDRHRNVAYAFAPGYGVRDGKETQLLGQYSGRGDRDRILPGQSLLKKLIQSNFVLTPSGMVRRECYQKYGSFDLNLPFCGDWHLWCLFALHGDVAYFAEPMLCYREHHDLSMTTKLSKERLEACADQEVSVPWLIRRAAEESGYPAVSRYCLDGAARTYGRVMAATRYRESPWFMNFDRFETSIREHTPHEHERQYLRAQTMMAVGNECYWRDEADAAKDFYSRALSIKTLMPAVWTKLALLSLGKPGRYVRSSIRLSR